MGIRPVQETIRENLEKQLEAAFEPLLIKSHLGKIELKGQSLPELKESLENINMLIANPNSFGVVKVSTSSRISAVAGDTNAEIQLGALSILLERKRLILDLIKEKEIVENVEGTIIIEGNNHVEN